MSLKVIEGRLSCNPASRCVTATQNLLQLTHPVQVREVLKDVASNGDAAVAKYAAQFDETARPDNNFRLSEGARLLPL